MDPGSENSLDPMLKKKLTLKSTWLSKRILNARWAFGKDPEFRETEYYLVDSTPTSIPDSPKVIVKDFPSSLAFQVTCVQLFVLAMVMNSIGFRETIEREIVPLMKDLSIKSARIRLYDIGKGGPACSLQPSVNPGKYAHLLRTAFTSSVERTARCSWSHVRRVTLASSFFTSIPTFFRVEIFSKEIRRLLSRKQYEETPSTGLRIKSKSKSNTTPIPMVEISNEISQILKMLEKMQAGMDESNKRTKTMIVKKNLLVSDEEEEEDKREAANKGEEEEKSAPLLDSRFNNHAGFTIMLKGKLPPKFTMPDTKFHGTKSPNHHMRNFISGMTLKAAQKLNNSKNPLGGHDNMFTINDNPKNDWDLALYIQSAREPRIRTSLPTQHSEVCGLWESDEEDVYETQGKFWLGEESDEDF
ncbi:hypothetical protein Cgig2_029022 [Carnegiea gigantea]|uniref:Uncharacterized protein n=1 Tax=Carnegiea gigantea TaxID=171969 RepID=A0A9Q1GZJ7_9CARY|nr:hypothetical protein Cgig2_029022 [Carnegiea gigantea]